MSLIPNSVRRSDTVTEKQRLESVERMAVLYTPAEECFDRITRLAARLFRTPIAVLSVVGDQRIWFKSRVGTEISEVSRARSFSRVAMDHVGPLVVPDALADPRFARCELVVNAPYARFYAGIAIRSPDGSKIGSLGVLDTLPRHIADSELVYLRDLAAIAEDEFDRRHLTSSHQSMIMELGEAQRRSLIDPLTNVWNRAGLESILASALEQLSARGAPLSVAMIDIDFFKEVNDKFGHGAGDTALVEVAHRLRAAARPDDSVTRFGGEEFVVVLPECDEGGARAVAERLRSCIAGTPVVIGQSLQLDITASIGVATAWSSSSPSVLLTRADVALYDAKGGGRNRVVVASPTMPVMPSRS